MQSLLVGSLDLCLAPRQVITAEFPDATKNALGLSAQLTGATAEYEDHYNNAPWSITLNIKGMNRALVDETLAAFKGTPFIVLGETSGTAKTVMVSRDTTSPDYDNEQLMITGQRSPSWLEEDVVLDPITVTGGRAVVSLPTVGGTIGARMSLTALSTSACTVLGIGIKPAPQAAYDPLDGSATLGTAVPLSTTPATLHAGTDIDVGANYGEHFGIAKLAHTSAVAGAVKYRLGSTLLTASAPDKYTASGVTNATETLCIGRVSIPAATLPTVQGTIYGSETGSPSNTGAIGSYVSAKFNAQSFGHAAGIHTGVTFWVRNITALPWTFTAQLWPATGTSPNERPDYNSSMLIFANAEVPASYIGPVRFNWSVDLPAGRYSAIIYNTYDQNFDIGAAGALADSNASLCNTAITDPFTITATTDLYFISHLRPVLAFNAKTPITATCSEASKTAQFASLTRIPADFGAIVAQGSFGAGTGITYDAATRGVYPANSSGVTGTALDPLTSACEFAPQPGANSLVVDNGGGSNVTLYITIANRRITRG